MPLETTPVAVVVSRQALPTSDRTSEVASAKGLQQGGNEKTDSDGESQMKILDFFAKKPGTPKQDHHFFSGKDMVKQPSF